MAIIRLAIQTHTREISRTRDASAALQTRTQSLFACGARVAWRRAKCAWSDGKGRGEIATTCTTCLFAGGDFRALMRDSISWNNKLQSWTTNTIFNCHSKFYHVCRYALQSTPDNWNLQGKKKKVRVIGSSSYRELRANDSRWGRDESSMHTALQGTQEIYWHFQGVRRHSLIWADTFSVMQKTVYTAPSQYIQCFGLQYYVFLDLSPVDKRGSSYRG